MGKWRTAIARSMCWAIFSRYCSHRTIKGAKRNVPHLLQAQQAPICLWSISERLQCQKFRGTVTKSTVSNRVCWSLKVLWGSVFAPLMVIVLWLQYREKIAQHMLRAIAVLHFPIYALKSCPAPAALAAGAAHYFSLTAYNLTFKPPYRGKGLKKDIS